MGVPADTVTELSDFLGLVNNLDPKEIPPGAATIQDNACAVKQGELQIRAGWREVTFEN